MSKRKDDEKVQQNANLLPHKIQKATSANKQTRTLKSFFSNTSAATCTITTTTITNTVATLTQPHCNSSETLVLMTAQMNMNVGVTNKGTIPYFSFFVNFIAHIVFSFNFL